MRTITKIGGLAIFMLGLSAWSGAGAIAAPFSTYSSESRITPFLGSTASDTGTASSSVILSEDNLARSFITPGTSIMGAEVRTNNSNAQTDTRHDDAWWLGCSQKAVCAVAYSEPAPISVTFGINGTASKLTSYAYFELDAHYYLSTGGAFSFYFTEDGTDYVDAGATYSSSTGEEIDLPVDVTLNDGVYSFSVTGEIHDQVCGLEAGCIPSATVCYSDDDCSGAPAFRDEQEISIDFDGDENSEFVDAFDPFTVDIVSLDPDLTFTSSGGRTIAAAATDDVPEPASLTLLASGLIAFRLRRPPRRAR